MMQTGLDLWVDTGRAPYIPKWFDDQASAYVTVTSAQFSNTPQFTFSMWFNPQSVTGTQKLASAAGRLQIHLEGAKLRVLVDDTTAATVWNVLTTDDVFTIGKRAHVYVSVDLSVPAATLEINRVAPALTVTTALVAGNGSVSHVRDHAFLADTIGLNRLDAHFTDLFFDPSAVHPNSLMWNNGQPPDLTGVGSPKVWLGDGQLAANLEADENLGSVTIVTPSATPFLDAAAPTS